MSSLIFWLEFYSHTWETLSISSSVRLLLLSSFSGSLVSILFTSSTTFLDTFFLGDVVLVFFFGDPMFVTKYNYILLKGRCHMIFASHFFQWIIFPRATENNTRVKSNFFLTFTEIFASLGAPLVSTTPVANFALVSTIPVARNGNNIRLLTR